VLNDGWNLKTRRGYRGGIPTAVQAWRTCSLWEPSPSHPILVESRGFAVFCVYCLIIVYFCVVCVLYVPSVLDTAGWVF